MTHDELLAQVDQWLTHSQTVSDEKNQAIKFLKAFRAVIELHKPNEYDGSTCEAHEECWGCGEWGGTDPCSCNSYPCETIEAIERELL